MDTTLKSTNHGKLFLVNLHDSLEKGVIDETYGQAIINELKSHFKGIGHESITDLEMKAESILKTLAETTICGDVKTINSPNKEQSDYYVHVMPKESLNNFIPRDVKKKQQNEQIENDGDDGFTLPKDKKNIFGIGRLWVSSNKNLWENPDADKACIELGLIHNYLDIYKEIEFVIIKIPKGAISKLNRPVVNDAGTHARFKGTHEKDDIKKQHESQSWGKTINLEDYSEASNEAVCLPIDLAELSKDNELRYKILGRTKKDIITGIEAHQDFITHILANRNINEIISNLNKKYKCGI